MTPAAGAGQRAEAGDDLVVAQGRPAAARCGTGARDRFDGLRVPRDCERIVLFGSESVPARLTLRGLILSIRVPGYFGGRVTIRVRLVGRIVARGAAPDRLRGLEDPAAAHRAARPARDTALLLPPR